MDILVISIFVFVIVNSEVNALHCLECADMPRPDACRLVTTCSNNSRCYVEQVVSSGGLILYNMGCLSSSRCNNKRPPEARITKLRKRQETVSRTDVVTCLECCDGDFCNIEGCGNIALRTPARPPMCFTCDSQLDPISCRIVEICKQDHDCALTQTTDNLWKSICVPSVECESNSKQNHDLCYTCCQDDFCNNNCGTQHNLSTTSVYNKEPTISTIPIVSPTKYLSTPTFLSTIPNVSTTKSGIMTHANTTTGINAASLTDFTVASSTSTNSKSSSSTLSTIGRTIIPHTTKHIHQSTPLSSSQDMSSLGTTTYRPNTAGVNALQCLECTDMPRPDACRLVTTCSSNSRCYVEQIVSSGGLILYNMGCLSSSRCDKKRSLETSKTELQKRQGTVSRTDVVTCVDCCDGDFCNMEGCGNKVLRPPARPPICFSCDSQQDPISCRDVMLCDKDHDCALTQTMDYSWKSMCVPSLQCKSMNKQDHDLCYSCCQDDFCNNNCSTRQSSSTIQVISTINTEPTASSIHIISPTRQETPSSSTSVNTITSSLISETTSTSFTTPVISSDKRTTSETLPNLKVSHSPTTYSSNSRTLLTSSTINQTTIDHTTKHIHHSTSPLPSSATETTSHIPNTTGDCLNRTFDICFVVDSSGSLGQDGFHREIELVKEVIKSISRQTNLYTRFCVITFSTYSHNDISLSMHSNTDRVLQQIGSIPYRDGETETQEGLHRAIGQLGNHGRTGSERVIILLTDGQSNDPGKTLKQAHHAIALGIDVFAVGVGNKTDASALESIAGSRSRVFLVQDVDHLKMQNISFIPAFCHT